MTGLLGHFNPLSKSSVCQLDFELLARPGDDNENLLRIFFKGNISVMVQTYIRNICTVVLPHLAKDDREHGSKEEEPGSRSHSWSRSATILWYSASGHFWYWPQHLRKSVSDLLEIHLRWSLLNWRDHYTNQPLKWTTSLQETKGATM